MHVDAELVIPDWNAWLELASGPRAVAGRTVDAVAGLNGYLVKLPTVTGAGTFDCMQQSVRIVPVTDTPA